MVLKQLKWACFMVFLQNFDSVLTVNMIVFTKASLKRANRSYYLSLFLSRYAYLFHKNYFSFF